LGLSDALGKDISDAIHTNANQEAVLQKLRHVVGTALRTLQFDPRLFACMKTAEPAQPVEAGLSMEEVREMTRYLAQEAKSATGSATELLC
jgi:hypothetical protein